LKRAKQTTTFHSEKGALMTGKTIKLIIIIVGFILDILHLIKDKMNGGKNGNKGDTEKK
jgi:hypothetical protein